MPRRSTPSSPPVMLPARWRRRRPPRCGDGYRLAVARSFRSCTRSWSRPAMFVRRAAVLAGLGFAAAALVFLYSHDPSASHLYPRCIFHALTGLQCPGCGATRALYHLLHGRIVEAMRFNALFIAFSPMLTIAG